MKILILPANNGGGDPFYDIDDDWDLIVSSFLTQYGIRLSRELKHMSFREFTYLLSSITPETPLGRIVSIRAETDPQVLKEFTPEMKKIRNDYLKKQALGKSKAEVDNAMEMFKQAFIRMAGGTHEEAEMQ